MDLFAGIAVREYAHAADWYERFFGRPPAFSPNTIEAVLELAEHRYVYIVEKPERAGSALVMAFVEDLAVVIDGLGSRGFEPARVEEYENGVRKVSYLDPEGNEISYGGQVGS